MLYLWYPSNNLIIFHVDSVYLIIGKYSITTPQPIGHIFRTPTQKLI